jgi:hypothetical protein
LIRISMSKQPAALLNAQAVHLDVLRVLEIMPDDWPLDVVSSFLQRSLRRQLHEQASWRILKSISAGQNLEISEAYLDAASRTKPVVEDKPSPGAQSFASRPDEGSIAEKEFVEEYDEKAGGEGMREKSFFSAKGVDKELRSLGRERGEEGPQEVV